MTDSMAAGAVSWDTFDIYVQTFTLPLPDIDIDIYVQTRERRGAASASLVMSASVLDGGYIFVLSSTFWGRKKTQLELPTCNLNVEIVDI